MIFASKTGLTVIFQLPSDTQPSQQQQPVQSENVLEPYNDSSPVIENVRCLYDFKAKTSEELSFRENDQLHILGKVENDPEWWVGRDREGKIGLVPRIYTERVEPEPGTDCFNFLVYIINSWFLHLALFLLTKFWYLVVEAGPYEDMKLKNWFFDTCETRDQAEFELRHGREGDFIVRPSESARGVTGSLSISVKGKAKNKHFKVTRDEGQYLIGQRKFSSVDDLIR